MNPKYKRFVFGFLQAILILGILAGFVWGIVCCVVVVNE